MSSESAIDAPATAAPHRSIQRLDRRLINQIAAGEVVTRPAAALKELIENCFDAGATRIEVAVEEGALSFSVRDDGVGMDEADLRLSIERHATSKIREYDDLMALSTRGFRGEALAAIASVSRLEITTRRRDEAEGRRLRASGGRDARIQPCGAPEGTCIVARDLFHNTPARLKFLKSPVAEWGHMLQTIVRQALTRPDVAFAIRWRGKPYLDLPANQSLIDRLMQVLPRGTGGKLELLAVDHSLHEARVHGAIAGPNAARRDRRHQYFFVNGRPIHARPLMFAMEEAYRGLLMTRHYPVAALFIVLPPEMVDVNVHPTKEEIRFRNEALAGGAVHRAVVEALRAAELVPMLQVAPPGAGRENFGSRIVDSGLKESGTAERRRGERGEEGQEEERRISRMERISAESAIRNPQSEFPGNANLPIGDLNPQSAIRNPQSEFPGNANLPIGDLNPQSAIRNPQSEVPQSAIEYAEPAAREEMTLFERLRRGGAAPRVLAQIATTYILADAGGEGVLVIDQHAAHEKILYREYLKQAERNGAEIEVQPLLLPHSIELAPAEVGALEALLPALRAAGFDVEPFGDRTYLVQAVPVVFEKIDVEAFVRDLIDDLGEGDLPRELRRLRERICARAACRAAVKSGDVLASAEMQRLVDQLLETGDALRCPHGRPTTLLLSRDQLDRQFGRMG